MKHYIPNISGFADFCAAHGKGEPIYLVNGKLVADYCLEYPLSSKYNLLFNDSKKEIEKAIAQNLYMFNIKETNNFYYPNTNMFSHSNAIDNISGLVLILKNKYRNPEDRTCLYRPDLFSYNNCED